MHVLNIRHVLDIILNHSSFEDGSAALKAVSLEVEYAKRELTTGKSIACYNTLINPSTIPYLTPETIRSHFTTFWYKVNLCNLNDSFFIDNCDLIDREKLKYLKRRYIKFDYDYRSEDILPYRATRNFSETFHNTFPDFKDLKMCYNCDCDNEVDILGQLCPTCTENKCPRCDEVPYELPLELDRWGCCSGCAGCKGCKRFGYYYYYYYEDED